MEKQKYNLENAKALENAKNEKFDEIVSLLDLFQGELSLNDVLNQDMIILTKLRESKLRINEKVAKEREKQARAIQSKR